MGYPPVDAVGPTGSHNLPPKPPGNFVALELGKRNTFLTQRRCCACNWTKRTIIIVIAVVALIVLVLGLGLGLGLKHDSASSNSSTSSTTSSPGANGNCCTVKCGTIGFSSSGQKCCGNSVSGQAGLHSYCSPALALAGCNESCWIAVKVSVKVVAVYQALQIINFKLDVYVGCSFIFSASGQA